MARDRFIKTKADFTIKKKVQTVDGGSIFESDYVTTTRPSVDWLFDSEQGTMADSNFVFTTRSTNNSKKRHRRNTESVLWVGNDGIQPITSESKIKLNLNANSLKDFAYYGSAYDMVKYSVNDIICNFPGEVYFGEKTIKINNQTYYIIENDFDINFESTTIPTDNIINENRYFLINYGNYGILKEGAILNKCISDVKVKSTVPFTCELNQNGGITSEIEVTVGDLVTGEGSTAKNAYTKLSLYVYTKNGEKTILYKQATYKKYRFRPNESVCEAFFNNLDNFQAVLLNRETNPLYKSSFYTPIETDGGTYTSKKDYIWPSNNGWNLDIFSSAFDMYLNGLLYIANFYDNLDTDNLWRRMTHQAIKNLDWTFIKKDGDDNITDASKLDNSRIEAIIKLYGRQYDDIKHYIDGIKRTNSVSLGENSCAPDYSLTDIAINKGWDVNMISTNMDNAIETSILYPSMSKGYKSTDANKSFLKSLICDSPYLKSIKGTKQGLEAMLGLLGFRNDDYTIQEFICVASGNTQDYISAHNTLYTGEPYMSGTGINYPVYNDIAQINEKRDDYYTNFDIPCKEVSFSRVISAITYIEGESAITSTTVSASYVVPWFSKDGNYEGEFYFQCKGGWGKTDEKLIKSSLAPNITMINSDSAFTIYEETVSNLKFLNSVEELKYISQLNLYNGLICYVTNTYNLLDYYTPKDEEKIANDYSHYFILKNIDYSTILGYSEKIGSYGWKNIPNTEIKQGINDGKKVLYLELMKETTDGNNPHSSNNSYDNGQEYLDKISEPFKYALEQNKLTRYTSVEQSAISAYKFTLIEQEDNLKCWYFTDIFNQNEKLIRIKKNTNGEYVADTSYSGETINSVTSGYSKNGVRDTFIATFNPEVGSELYRESDEAAANSIINTKKLVLNFNVDFTDNNENELMKYIKLTALPYIIQMIPSSTIFEYHINKNKSNSTI